MQAEINSKLEQMQAETNSKLEQMQAETNSRLLSAKPVDIISLLAIHNNLPAYKSLNALE